MKKMKFSDRDIFTKIRYTEGKKYRENNPFYFETLEAFLGKKICLYKRDGEFR